MELKRRALITQPGEHLLLPTSVLGVIEHYETFRAFTGIDEDDLLLTPLSTVPLPTPWTVPAGRRRWEGVRPEAMWHPLLWLPERMATWRRLYDAETGQEWTETYDDWTVRVVLELCESTPVTIANRAWVRLYDFAGSNLVRPAGPADTGLVDLYDPASGTWLDVLSTVGLDIDSAIDLARVEAWLEGEPDPALDSVDLEQFLRAPGRYPDWAVDRAHRKLDDTDSGGTNRSYVADLRDASTALVARELSEKSAELTEAPDVPPAEVARRVISLTSIATGFVSLDGEEAEDFGMALDAVTFSAAEVETAVQAREVAMELSQLMGSLLETKIAGIDRLGLRLEVETAEILREIEEIHQVPVDVTSA